MALLVVAIIASSAPPSFGALSDSAALSKARSIWGPFAVIGEIRGTGDVYWVKQVGCLVNGVFIVAGAGKATYDAAFAAVDMSRNGPGTIKDISSESGVVLPYGVVRCNAAKQ